MGKISYMKLKGSQNMRLRLLLSTLSSTPIIIEDIHAEATLPGVRPHEVSLLHLLEKVSDDCVVEINETGTKLKYKPGIVMGGRHLDHDCGFLGATDSLRFVWEECNNSGSISYEVAGKEDNEGDGSITSMEDGCMKSS